jgi:4a-hydroxytetrahydrobiopterin dehydratase
MNGLNPVQIKKSMKDIPLWGQHTGAIERLFMFKDFSEAFDFVNKVAKLSQKNNHHPNIEIRYHKVILRLTTHDVGGLTKKDFIMAKKFDDCLGSVKEV